jgi:hypothetical protein
LDFPADVQGFGSRSTIDRSVWRATVMPICASSPAAWIVVLISSAVPELEGSCGRDVGAA